MKIEKIRLRNFRCFGDEVIEFKFEENLTTLVGGNGSGKTAVLQAVSRLFGTSSAQRSVQRRDFHIAVDRQELRNGEQLFIEAILAFPELADQDDSSHNAVPEFSTRCPHPARESLSKLGSDYRQHGRMTARLKGQSKRIHVG